MAYSSPVTVIIFSKIHQLIPLDECILCIYKTVLKYIILIGSYIDHLHVNYQVRFYHYYCMLEYVWLRINIFNFTHTCLV